VRGKKIKSVSRRAKMLIIELSGKTYLAIHLKMTGQLVFQPKRGELVVGGHPQKNGLDALPNKYTHITLQFVDGTKLYFNDLRKFGWMRAVDQKALEAMVVHYGVEPLSKDFTVKYLTQLIERFPKRNIKKVIMDQELVVGIGNIYADESCFSAGILPTRLAKDIAPPEIKKLHHHIRRILKLAIDKKGTSARNYLTAEGIAGNYVKYLNVYGRHRERCKQCCGDLSKISLNGRGTHFCIVCQK
jgi:formamidopyrimidine-DNA glycosylase